MKFAQLLLIIFMLSLLPACLSAQGIDLEVTARVLAEPLDEISGMVKSRGRDNVYWVVNDSGDRARFFAINREGKTIIPTFSKFSFYGEEKESGKEQWQGFRILFANNVDWEDMAIDEKSLYIADTGNNSNARQDLGIYIVSEIDPTASTQSAVIKHIPVSYPEQKNFPAEAWHFDSESLFSNAGSLYLITKHRQAGILHSWEAGANLYRLDTQFSDQDNPLTLIDSHPAITAATSAEISPDGKVLAVLSLSALWLFDKPDSGDHWLSSTFRKIELKRRNIRQAESLTWEDDKSLWIINEQRDMFYVELESLLAQP